MHILKADIFTLEKPDISILGLHFIFRIIAIMLILEKFYNLCRSLQPLL